MLGRIGLRLTATLLVAVVSVGAASALEDPLAGPAAVEPRLPLVPTADHANVDVAGVEVAVPLPVKAPVTTDVDVPVTGVDLSLGDDSSDTAGFGSSDPAPQASGRRDFALADVPPAAVAVGGFSILALFAGAAASGLFSRIEGPAVLMHPTRARLLALVTEQPGLTIQRAQELLGAAWGTTIHHVRRLEENGHLASVRQGPRVLLYAANSPQAHARKDLALLHNDTARQIARAVAGTPGIRTSGVSTSLGIATPSASKHLSRFAAAGLVEHPEAGGFVATQRLHHALALAT